VPFQPRELRAVRWSRTSSPHRHHYQAPSASYAGVVSTARGSAADRTREKALPTSDA
jgi:hypothetical protein